MSQSLNIRKEFAALNLGSTPVSTSGGGNTVGVGEEFTISGTPTNRMYVDNNNINASLPIISSNTAASTSDSTGSIITQGGIAIANATQSVSSTNGGALTISGGVGIAKKLFIGGSFNTLDTTASLSSTTGAITLPGGIGISNSTDATSSTNGGTITTAGGVGIAKKLYVGSDFTLAGDSIMNNNKSIILKDASGTNPRFVTQNDNNFVFYGTDAAGSDRAILACSMRSSTSPLNVNIDTIFNSTKASTSSSSGAVVSAGGISISNSTNSVSRLNGGSFTTAGGAGIAQNLFVGGNIEIDSTGWAIFPNKTGCGTVPNLGTGHSLQVKGGLTLGGGLSQINASDQVCGVFYTSGSEDITFYRNFNNVASLIALQSTAADPNPSPLPDVGDISLNREATLALIRTDDAGNEEFLDLFNNGYFRGPYPDTSYGIRLQKRGTGTYRDFVIQYSSGLDDVNDVLRFDATTFQPTIISGLIVGCQSAAAAPTTPAPYLGQEYYDTGDGNFYKYNGSTWLRINNV